MAFSETTRDSASPPPAADSSTLPAPAGSSAAGNATLLGSARRWWGGLSWLEALTLIVVAALFIVRNIPWRVDNFDQAKQAYVSLEMLGSGEPWHWFYQHTPGEFRIATKPPLLGWLSALLYYPLLGNWDLAWRLPSLLAALALTFALWRAGREDWPRLGGALAAGAFGLNYLSPHVAMLVRTDMLLALWIGLLGLLIWWKLHRGFVNHAPEPWTLRERLLVAALLVAAMLTKGPIVYAFLLPGMALHCWINKRRGWHAHAASSAWSGWASWTLPLVPFVIWLAIGIAELPGFYEQVVGREFFGRFTVGERAVHNNQPVWFYFPHLFVRWAPWSLLLIGVRFLAPRRWWRAATGDPATLWLVCWAVGGLFLMSAVPSKRVDRIFPVLAPFSLLLTAVLARVHREQQSTDIVVTNDTAPTRVAFWARATLVVALVTATATTVTSAVRENNLREGALAMFGAKTRRLVKKNNWRVAVVSNQPQYDEAMLVYLRQLRFLTTGEAITARDERLVDALVVPERFMDSMRDRLGQFTLVAKSATPDLRKGRTSVPRYWLICWGDPKLEPGQELPVRHP